MNCFWRTDFRKRNRIAGGKYPAAERRLSEVFRYCLYAAGCVWCLFIEWCFLNQTYIKLIVTIKILSKIVFVINQIQYICFNNSEYKYRIIKIYSLNI